jgi:hypothetical protein
LALSLALYFLIRWTKKVLGELFEDAGSPEGATDNGHQEHQRYYYR